MLDDFYRSDPWRDLLKIIRNERTHEDGLIYCEHCGKPIVRAYDCIGHHVKELTESNYQIADISLNPDNIILVHHRCHNKIHNKLGHSARQVFLVYGSPLSGKTTWVSDVHIDGDLIIDMDSIWQCISGNERYIKDNRLNSVAFGVRDELIRMVKVRQGFWRNAYVIGGYPLISERERLCRLLGAREVYVDSTYEECVARLEASEDARDKKQWMKFIDEWWTKYSPPGK